MTTYLVVVPDDIALEAILVERRIFPLKVSVVPTWFLKKLRLETTIHNAILTDEEMWGQP